MFLYPDVFNRKKFNPGLQKKMLVIYLMFLFTIIQAQSLSVVSYDSIVIGDAIQSNAIYAHASVKNLSAKAIDVKVKRIDANYNALTDNNAICWGICYPPESSESSFAIEIEAGGIDSLNFTGHVYPDKDGVPASGDITYVFFNANNPSDSVSMEVHYKVLLTSSIDEDISSRNVFVFPNPNNGYVNLRFHEKIPHLVSFNLYSDIGKIVYKKRVNGKNEITGINLTQLKKGTYLYSITEDINVLETGKLMLH